ncbi:hypothetical protein Tco_0038781 [Tanacetum coccineum]
MLVLILLIRAKSIRYLNVEFHCSLGPDAGTPEPQPIAAPSHYEPATHSYDLPVLGLCPYNGRHRKSNFSDGLWVNDIYDDIDRVLKVLLNRDSKSGCAGIKRVQDDD